MQRCATRTNEAVGICNSNSLGKLVCMDRHDVICVIPSIAVASMCVVHTFPVYSVANTAHDVMTGPPLRMAKGSRVALVIRHVPTRCMAVVECCW